MQAASKGEGLKGARREIVRNCPGGSVFVFLIGGVFKSLDIILASCLFKGLIL